LMQCLTTWMIINGGKMTCKNFNQILGIEFELYELSNAVYAQEARIESLQNELFEEQTKLVPMQIELQKLRERRKKLHETTD
jgi:uncharacterized coiled-coil protein SlyX